MIGENERCFLILSLKICHNKKLRGLFFIYQYSIASKKKARTFDFMEMFKEAKQTALERSQGI